MDNHTYIKTASNEYTKVAYQEILWIESDGHFCTIHCEEEKKIKLKVSLSSLEENLPQVYFIRIRRNTIVNKVHVSGIHLLTDQVLLKDISLSIGKTYKAKILEQFSFLG